MSQQRVRLLGRFRQMDEAVQRKMIKYTWSGLLIIAIGLVLIIVGVGREASPTQMLLIGFGAIVVLVGIIRVLIGFINPRSPSDLSPLPPELVEQTPTGELHEQIFEKQQDTL